MTRHLLLACLISSLFVPTEASAVLQDTKPAAPSRNRASQPAPSQPGADKSSTSAPKNPDFDGPEQAVSTPTTDEPKFSLFGDTAKFGRLGGWGGIGGTMGQFGFGPSMLVMTPAIQKELELNDDQKQALRDWSLQMRDHGQEMARSMRNQGEANLRQMDIPGAMRMMGQLNTLLQQNEQGVRKILTKSQWTRLNQISLQMEGVTALTRPDIAQALVLAPEQYEQIRTIMAQTQFRQIGYWMQQGMAMRERVEAERRQRGDSRKPSPEADSPANRPEADGQRTAPSAETDTDASSQPDRQRLRRERINQFDSMREGADRIQQETVNEILRILTKRQRSKFEKMLGPPFNPDKVTEGWDRPRGESDSNGGANGPASQPARSNASDNGDND